MFWLTKLNNTVIVTIVLYNNSGTVTVTDTGSNTYNKDADITDSASTRTLVFSAPVTTALTTSSTITVGFSSNVRYKNASAFYVSGLVTASPADKSATATGTTTSASVGPTATTSQANELIVGAFGLDINTGSPTFTAGTGYTTLPANVISGAWGIYPEYQIVSATGTYSATGTFSAGGVADWAAAIVTYKANLAATQLAFTTEPVTTTAGSTMANVVVQLQNSFGSNVASNNVPVTLTLSSGSFASGTLTVNSDSTGKATFNNLVINTAGTGYTITAAASGIGAGLTSATSSSFNINAAAVSQLAITNTVVTVTAGVASSLITVQRQDAYGNPTTNGTTTVNLTTTSTGGSFLNTNGVTAITSTNILPNASTASYFYKDTVAGSPTITNSVTGGSLTSDTQVVTVNPAVISQLVMNPVTIASATAGTSVSGSFTSITAEDAYGNICSSGPNAFTGTVTFGGTALATGTSAAFTAGVLNTFPALTPTLAGSGKTITATSGAVVGTTTITTVSPGPVSQFVIAPATVTSATAGTAFALTSITAEDANGNICSSGPNVFTGTVTYGGTAGVTGTSAAFTAGVLSSPSVTATVAGSGETVTVNDGSGHTGSATITTVSAGSATKMVVTLPGQTFTAGSGNSGTVTAQTAGTSFVIVKLTAVDNYNNIATSYTGSKTISYTGPANSPSSSAPTYITAVSFTAGQSTTTLTTTLKDAQTTTITATDGTLTGVASSSLTINPAVISQLVMNPVTIASATAGTSVSGSFTSITAEDAYGNICSSGPNAFTGTVTFGGTALATGTSAAFTAGVLNTFPALTPTLAGSGKTITATSGAVVGTTTITTVSPGAASKLVMKTEPSASVTVGAAFGTQPAVYVEDTYGNVVTSDGSTVTATVGTGTGPLTGTLTAVASSGVATFSGLAAPTLAQTGLKLTFTDGSLASAVDATSITVNPGAISQLVMNPTTIASATAGTSVSSSFTSITAEDAYGNVCSSGPNAFTSTVTFGGTAGATGTSAAFTAGVLTTFPALTPTSAGSGKTITATTGAVVGTTTITTVNPGAIASYTVSAAAATRGTAFNVTVTAKDANGNTVTTDSSTVVTMTSSSGNVQFTGSTTLSSGTFTISALDNFAETVTITATDANSKTGNTSVTNALTGDYRSQVSGNWGTAATWQTWSGSAWGAASSPPTNGTFTGEINVQGGFTVTNATSASVPSSLFVVNSGSTVSISSGQTLTVGNGVAYGVISGAGILAENGTGTTVLTLNGANTYSGGTIITGDTVSVTNVNSTGNQNLGSGGITFASGGTLLCGGPSGQSTAKAITLNTGGGVITMSGATITLTGTISGGGGLTSSGSDLILAPTSANTIGTMTVNSGRLFVNSTNAIANSAVLNINSGATLDFQYTATPLNTMTFASGACLANRSGTLTVSTANVSFPTAGTMIFNQDDVVGTPIIVNGTYPTLTGALTIQVGGFNASVGTVTLSGAISGSYGITKTSTGTLVLGSANTYTGGTTVSTGSLTAYVNNSLGSGALSIASGATVTLTNSTSDTVAGLFLNGVRQVAGTWGGTAATGASNKNGTYFGTTATGVLNVSAGTATQVIVTLPGQTFTSGSGNTGTVSGQTAGNPFNITLTAADASKNIDTLYTGSQTVSYSGPANAPGGATPTYTTTVTFVNGQATSVATTLVDAQTTTITPTITGLTGVASSSLTVNPSAVTAAQSTVTASPASVTADGVTTSTVTVTLNDANMNPVSGKTVTLAKTSGSGSPTISAASGASSALGVVTFTVKSTTAAADVFTATDSTDSLPITQTATVTFTAGAATKLVITSTAVTTTAGVASSTITVQRQDANGNPNTTDAARTVTLASTSTGTVTFSPASPLTISTGSSTATFTYTDTKAGTPTITAASTSPTTITSATQVETVNPASANAANSIISASPTSITANGTSTSTITVTEKDAYGNSLTASGTTPVLSSSAGSLGSVVNNNNGTFSATLTSATAVGTANQTGTISSVAIGTTTSVLFTASSANALISSVNPGLPGTSVIFTATLSAVSPSTGTPTGTVIFKYAGTPFYTNTLAGGSTTATNSTLPHGNDAITAEYSGNTYFLTSTGSLTQVIDTPPVGGTHYLGATVSTTLTVSASVLASLDYDADNDTLTITAVSSPSAHGTVSLSGGNVIYTPTTSYVGADSFTYTISDGYTGGTATSTASVTVSLGKATSVLYPPTVGAGVVNLVGYGIPTHAYDIQRSPDLSTWTAISLSTYPSGITAASNGIILYTDTNPLTTAYYRLVVH